MYICIFKPPLVEIQIHIQVLISVAQTYFLKIHLRVCMIYFNADRLLNNKFTLIERIKERIKKAIEFLYHNRFC